MPSYLAILADSHDSADALTAALELLQPHHPLAYLHLGDLCEPAMLDTCAGLVGGAPFHFIFGNNDFDHEGLRRRAAALHLHCHGLCGELTLEQKRLAFLHGDNHTLLDQLLDSQKYDYLFHGHTHVRATARHGKTRIINPGALYRAKPKTVALLELHSDTLQYLTL